MIQCWLRIVLLALGLNEVVGFFLRGKPSYRVWRAVLLATVFFVTPLYAVTPAGTIIRSQAQATYLDEYGTRLQSSSNEVQMLIQAVAGVLLEPAKQTRIAVPGQSFSFTHILTNTGNVTGVFVLSQQNGSSVRFYRDDDKDGQIGNGQDITGQGISLAAGQSIHFIVAGNKAENSTINIQVRVAGSDQFDEARDSIITSAGEVYSVTKQVNPVAVNVPTDTDSDRNDYDKRVGTTPYRKATLRIYYERIDSNNTQSSLIVSDTLPEGMILEKTIAVKVRPEGAKSDIIYLAPNSGGNKDSKRYQYDESSRKLTLRLDDHKKDAKGKIEFQVRVQNVHAGQVLYNHADYRFCTATNESICSESQKTNRAPLYIYGYDLSLNGSSLSSAKNFGEPVYPEEGHIVEAGSILTFINYLWNTSVFAEGSQQGISNYTVDVESFKFPTGSKICLTDQKECRPEELTDLPAIVVKNVRPNEFRKIILKVKLPDELPHSNNLRSVLRAINAVGKQVFVDTSLNILGTVRPRSASVVWSRDKPTLEKSENTGSRENNASGSSTHLPVVAPDGTLTIDNLYINNTGEVADSYNLTAYGDQLPEGFALLFYDSENHVPLANSGVISGKTGISPNKKIKLLISVPPETKPGTYEFTIKAQSPVYQRASDTLPLSFTVKAPSLLALEPDNEGQIIPGGFTIFTHQLTNQGSIDVKNINLLLADSLVGEGWQSLVYEDKSGDGEISSDDSVINPPFSLKAGASMFLIIKVFAPANAPQSSKNITRVKLSWGPGRNITVTDTAKVNNTNVVIIKEQAPDANPACDGEPDAAYSRTSFPAVPGTCVLYKVTATNRGAEAVNHVVIDDRAPGFTVFLRIQNKLPVTKDGSATLNSIENSKDSVRATWDSLLPGASVTLYFGIKIQ